VLSKFTPIYLNNHSSLHLVANSPRRFFICIEMASKNRHKHVLAIVEVMAAPMASEHQFAYEPEGFDDDPEEEFNPFGLGAGPSDHTGLDPKTRADPW